MEIDPNLLVLARNRAYGLKKTAFVPPGGSDPAAGMPPPPPGAMSAGGAPAPPMGMAPPGGAAPPPGGAPPMPGAPPQDPAAAAAMQAPLPGSMPGGAAPPPAQPGAAGAAGPQKLKPEQMMQMIDMRLFNLQMQMTAVMNAVNAKVDNSALVLPPGMTSAPQAEMALPGGPMDPAAMQAATGGTSGGDPAAAAGGAPPMDPAAAAGGAPPMDPAAAAGGKTAAVNFAEAIADEQPASYIGDMTDVGVEVDELQKKADTLMLLLKAARARQAA